MGTRTAASMFNSLSSLVLLHRNCRANLHNLHTWCKVHLPQSQSQGVIVAGVQVGVASRKD